MCVFVCECVYVCVQVSVCKCERGPAFRAPDWATNIIAMHPPVKPLLSLLQLSHSRLNLIEPIFKNLKKCFY